MIDNVSNVDPRPDYADELKRKADPGPPPPKRVILESPYAGDVERNVAYARACLLHSLSLGEAPIASHLLYTQVLDDRIPEQRTQGIAAGLEWRHVASLAAFYVDLGVSEGMLHARKLYKKDKTPTEDRTLHPMIVRLLKVKGVQVTNITAKEVTLKLGEIIVYVDLEVQGVFVDPSSYRTSVYDRVLGHVRDVVAGK